jgi:hypothetical protein
MYFHLPTWAGLLFAFFVIFWVLMYLFQIVGDEPAQPDEEASQEHGTASPDGVGRSAVREYLLGLKVVALNLLGKSILPFATTVMLGWMALAFAGIHDLFASSPTIFTHDWQRVSSWIAILLWVVVLVVLHIRNVREKGRNFLGRRR